MEIPGIGLFRVHSGVCAVMFDEFFIDSVKVFRKEEENNWEREMRFFVRF